MAATEVPLENPFKKEFVIHPGALQPLTAAPFRATAAFQPKGLRPRTGHGGDLGLAIPPQRRTPLLRSGLWSPTLRGPSRGQICGVVPSPSVPFCLLAVVLQGCSRMPKRPPTLLTPHQLLLKRP